MSIELWSAQILEYGEYDSGLEGLSIPRVRSLVSTCAHSFMSSGLITIADGRISGGFRSRNGTSDISVEAWSDDEIIFTDMPIGSGRNETRYQFTQKMPYDCPSEYWVGIQECGPVVLCVVALIITPLDSQVFKRPILKSDIRLPIA